MKTITENELNESLDALRYALSLFDYSKLYNVIFFNFHSLYVYMNEISCRLPQQQDKPSTVGDLLEILEPYIPFALTESTLEFFLKASMATNEVEMKELESQFAVRSKLDFMNMVRTASSPEEWENIVRLCQSLRNVYPAESAYNTK